MKRINRTAAVMLITATIPLATMCMTKEERPAEEDAPYIMTAIVRGLDEGSEVTLHHVCGDSVASMRLKIKEGLIQAVLPPQSRGHAALVLTEEEHADVTCEDGLLTLTAKAHAGEDSTAVTYIKDGVETCDMKPLYRTVRILARNEMEGHTLTVSGVALHGITETRTYGELDGWSRTAEGTVRESLPEAVTLGYGQEAELMTMSMPADSRTGSVRYDALILTATVCGHGITLFRDMEIRQAVDTEEQECMTVTAVMKDGCGWTCMDGTPAFDQVFFGPSTDDWQDVIVQTGN